MRRNRGFLLFVGSISACIAATLIVDGEAMFHCLLAGWGVIAIVVVVWLWPRGVANSPLPLTPPPQIAAFFALTLVLHASLSLLVLTRAHGYGLSVVTSSNLYAIGRAMREYCREFGQATAEPRDLIAAGFATPETFCNPFDYGRQIESPSDSSYVLMQTNAACTSVPAVVAYERESWSPVRLSILRHEVGHQALLGDGSIRRLTSAELSQLLASTATGNDKLEPPTAARPAPRAPQASP